MLIMIMTWTFGYSAINKNVLLQIELLYKCDGKQLLMKENIFDMYNKYANDEWKYIFCDWILYIFLNVRNTFRIRLFVARQIMYEDVCESHDSCFIQSWMSIHFFFYNDFDELCFLILFWNWK